MRRPESIVRLIHGAARRLWRSPGFTAAVVGSLALGVGANTTVFTLVRRALLRPLPYPESDKLVAIATLNRDGTLWQSMTCNLLRVAALELSAFPTPISSTTSSAPALAACGSRAPLKWRRTW